MPEFAKDVMVGILGASVGLAGLLLVFCGFVFGQAAGFPPETTDDATIARYKRAGTRGLCPFVVALGDSWLVVLWFLFPTNACIYFAAIGVFLVLLTATAAYGAWVISSLA